VCWGGELEFLELAAVGGDFLRKRARETSEAPACMLTLRLSSRRQCARWESAEEVVGAAVAVTEDLRVAVVVVVLGEDMGRAAAEGITDRRHGALSRTPRLPAITANQCGQTGPQCNRPMCLSKTLSKEMPRGKAVVSAARGTSWYSRCNNQSECLIKTKDARDGTTTTKRTQYRTVPPTLNHSHTHGSRASATRAHQQGSMATSSCILSHTRRDAHREPAHPPAL
jgi:hypothetical protein